MSGPGEPDNGQLRAARTVVAALARAVRSYRSGSTSTRLRQLALARLQRAATLPSTALHLRLAPTSIHLGDQPIHAEADADWLAPLAEAGVGALHLEPDSAAGLQALAEVLGTPPIPGEEPDPVLRLRSRGAPGVHLLPAATALPSQPSTPPPFPSPPAPPLPQSVRTALAREHEADLPALAARWLLTDIAREPGRGHEALLAPLLQAMLDRADLQGAAWLLREVSAEPAAAFGLPDLLAAVHQRFQSPWLEDHLRQATGDEALALANLAMELGRDTVSRLLAAGLATEAPLPPWLTELLMTWMVSR